MRVTLFILASTFVLFALQSQLAQGVPFPGRNQQEKELDLGLSLSLNPQPNHGDTSQQQQQHHHDPSHGFQNYGRYAWQDNPGQWGESLFLGRQTTPDGSQGHIDFGGVQGTNYWNRAPQAMDVDPTWGRDLQLSNHPQASYQLESSSHHGQYSLDASFAPSFQHMSMYPSTLYPDYVQSQSKVANNHPVQSHEYSHENTTPYSIGSAVGLSAHITDVGQSDSGSDHAAGYENFDVRRYKSLNAAGAKIRHGRERWEKDPYNKGKDIPDKLKSGKRLKQEAPHLYKAADSILDELLISGGDRRSNLPASAKSVEAVVKLINEQGVDPADGGRVMLLIGELYSRNFAGEHRPDYIVQLEKQSTNYLTILNAEQMRQEHLAHVDATSYKGKGALGTTSIDRYQQPSLEIGKSHSSSSDLEKKSYWEYNDRMGIAKMLFDRFVPQFDVTSNEEIYKIGLTRKAIDGHIHRHGGLTGLAGYVKQEMRKLWTLRYGDRQVPQFLLSRQAALDASKRLDPAKFDRHSQGAKLGRAKAKALRNQELHQESE